VRPGGLQQAQHGIKCVARSIVSQQIALRMAEFQTQIQAGVAVFEGGDQVFAGDQPLRCLACLVIAFVTALAQHLARQQAGVALQRHAHRAVICAAVVRVTRAQAGQGDASLAQQRNTGVQHVGHRRVDPLHT